MRKGPSNRDGCRLWNILWWYLVLRLGAVASYSAAKSLRLGTGSFLLRPYCSMMDYKHLVEMCKDVYGGTDDLPIKARILQEDPKCEFLVLEDEANGNLVAAGNLQNMGNNTIFLEAIRVSPLYEGRGIATLWMRELIDRCQDNCHELLSCTVDSNEAMKAIFAKPGIELVPVSTFRIPNWKKMSKLPGWNKSSTMEPQNILQALGYAINDTSKNVGIWEPIRTYDELQKILGASSGIGHLTSIEKPMDRSEELLDSLQKGLVRRLRNADPPVVFGLVWHSQPNLKSEYVCSIIASNEIDADAGLCEACREEYVPLLGGNPAFSVVLEQIIPSGSLQEALLSVQTEKVYIHYRRWMKDSFGCTSDL